MKDKNLSDLAYVLGGPLGNAQLRMQPSDFQVVEDLGYEPEGSGEHIFLWVEKAGANTQWLAEQLAKFVGIKPRDVGFAGLKDRQAVTRQWFSLYCPGNQGFQWEDFTIENIRILSETRHTKKLRRGNLRGNYFTIKLREVDVSPEQLQQRLEQLCKQGMPNYFGAQRFGNHGNNLQQAQWLFDKKIKPNRSKRSLYLSAARSFLFNLVLSKRIENNTWDTPQPGDLLMLRGSHSFFLCEELTEDIIQRTKQFDLSPTGPLFGKGELGTTQEIHALETQRLNQKSDWHTGLIAAGLEQARRPLRIPLENLSWQFQEKNQLELKFFLPAGSYATSLIRELVNI